MVDGGIGYPCVIKPVFGVELFVKGDQVEGVAEALRVPESGLRLFGKPESLAKRRMGVAVANADAADEARERAKRVANRVKPVRVQDPP